LLWGDSHKSKYLIHKVFGMIVLKFKAAMLLHNFDCFFLEAKSLFFFKTPRGIAILKLSSFFFFKSYFHGFAFCFGNKSAFRNFIHCFFSSYSMNFYFFFKIKVRGLGYRIKKITNDLFRFFLGSTNLFFFHVPKGLLIRVRRRRMLLVSYDYRLLTFVFSHLLLLKKLIPYKLRGVFFPKQVILLKPGKKSF
jgi:hypothetical protein